MQEFGELLRNAREAQGMTLEEVEKVTKIRRKYLEAIENGDVSEMPGEVQLRGFIRNYAAAVGLDPGAVMERYLEWRGAETAAGDGAFAGRRTEILVVEERRPRKLLVAVILALLLAVAGVLYYFFLVYSSPHADNDVSSAPAAQSFQVSASDRPLNPKNLTAIGVFDR